MAFTRRTLPLLLETTAGLGTLNWMPHARLRYCLGMLLQPQLGWTPAMSSVSTSVRDAAEFFLPIDHDRFREKVMCQPVALQAEVITTEHAHWHRHRRRFPVRVAVKNRQVRVGRWTR